MAPRATTFPSRADLAFYQRQQRLPRWAQPLAEDHGGAHDPIDDCVNAHAAGLRSTAGEIAAHNLLAIIRLMQKRLARRATWPGANLAAELYKIADAPGCAIDPAKRAAFARKWADRLTGARGRRGMP